MTIKPHLFYSSLIHIVLIAYLVSIPIYKGSLYSMSFGHYSVDLVSEGKASVKAPVARKAPRAKAKAPVKQQAAAVKPKEPEAAEVPKTEEPISETIAQNETQPEGITLMPEEPKKESMIAKAELPVVEHKPEPEKKPEPPKPEPVVIPPPPEPKPEPDPIEPEPIPPAETKPSLTDPIEEPAQTEFPVKADKKATEISPLTETKKDVKSDPMSEMRSLDRKFRSEINTADKKPDQVITKVASAGKVQGKVGEKGSKKAGEKSVTPAKAESSAPKSDIDQSSAGNDTTETSAVTPGDSSNPGEGKNQSAGITVPEAEKPKEKPQKKPSLGIAVSDALFYRDIKIEIFLTEAESAGITTSLFRKTHPSVEEYGRSEQKSVDLKKDSETDAKIIFWVAKAEKGIYTFVMQNTSETPQKTSLMIRLLEGKKGARNRKFDLVNLSPHARLAVKFILPEGIFWDDEPYFTGSIESSETITKFNDTTGIVWKEYKEE